MSKVLDYIKAALQIAFSLVVLAIILLNFPPLNRAFENLLEQAASISAIDIFGIKLTFTKETNELQLNYDESKYKELGSESEAAYKKHIEAQIHALDQEEIVRLMYVGQLKNLCEFETPTTEMRKDVAADYSLRDKGLTKIEINPATLESVRAELAKMVAQGKSLDIGYPRVCYDMSLTEKGSDVKTVLVKTLSARVGAPSASK